MSLDVFEFLAVPAGSASGSALATALVDVDALADEDDDIVHEVEEPPQPDSDRLSAATAMGVIRALVSSLDMARVPLLGICRAEHSLPGTRALGKECYIGERRGDGPGLFPIG